ncbi:hypothetical protein ON010_g11452 [Phytophthora cinnamomi]|nr:hypothetical protein ON010_g11452 [Phytophthora cinnamomi]
MSKAAIHQVSARVSASQSAKFFPAKRSELASKQSQRKPIPPEVRKALPRQGGKEVCLRYLSQEGCRGWNGQCRVEGRVHFKPAALTDVVKQHIEKAYGGLAPDMQ